MPTKRAAAKPAKSKKVEKPKLTAKKPAAKPVAAKASSKPAPVKAAFLFDAVRARLRHSNGDSHTNSHNQSYCDFLHFVQSFH